MLRGAVRAMVPPPVYAIARWARGLLGTGLGFSGSFDTWEDAVGASTGYDQTAILERVRCATGAVVSGRAAYERDSVLFTEIPDSFPLLSGLLRAANMSAGVLRVLDYGGSLGSSYRQCRAFLGTIPTIRWYVVEQEHFARCGRDEFQTDELRFFDTPAEAAAAAGSVDVVLLSGVLQYLPEPYSVLEELGSLGSRHLIIDVTPFSKAGEDKLVVQRVPASIYAASYPCWIFSAGRMRASLERDWQVVSDFEAGDGAWFAGTSRFKLRGLILQRKE